MKLSEIQIRDPFILPLPKRGEYLLFGSTDKNVWEGPGVGFDCYRSRDLLHWDGPIPAFRAPAGFWATTQFWAPEVFAYSDRYFMFATFKYPGRCRGTQILAAECPEGPFEPWSNGPVTPADWDSLDGTLYVDETGAPWMIFCHEWKQVHDGTMAAMRLSPDLRCAAGEPIVLFAASDAPWVRPVRRENQQQSAGAILPGGNAEPYVTDGPFLHHTQTGALLMLWSSFGAQGYAMGISRSASGMIAGPWMHEPEPLWEENGGHGMIFRTFDGELLLTLHQPNQSPDERAHFHRLVEIDETLRLEGRPVIRSFAST